MSRPITALGTLETYEIRVGHSAIWSTAQGRFGRPLRTTGVQHPAPTLFCTRHRDEVELLVHAPHAMAVLNGENITADPPRTEIWALLYAQVKQADGKDHRNILLDERKLRLIPKKSETLITTRGRRRRPAGSWACYLPLPFSRPHALPLLRNLSFTPWLLSLVI